MPGKQRSRKLFPALTLCLALAPGGAPAAKAQHAPAQTSAAQAAGLPMIDLGGYRKIVADHRGQAVLVSFWATWCEPCQTEFPTINHVARKYGPQGLAVVGISLDQAADLNVERDFLKRMKPVFPSYRKQPGNDDQFIRGIAPDWDGAIPATALYARDGRLAVFIVGQNSPSGLEKSVERLLATSAK